MSAWVYGCVDAWVYAWVYVCMYVCVCVYVCMCMYVCMYVCMCLCVCSLCCCRYEFPLWRRAKANASPGPVRCICARPRPQPHFMYGRMCVCAPKDCTDVCVCPQRLYGCMCVAYLYLTGRKLPRQRRPTAAASTCVLCDYPNA